MGSETIAARVAVCASQTSAAVGTATVAIRFVTVGPQIGAGLRGCDAAAVVAGVRRALLIVRALDSNVAGAELLTGGFGAGQRFGECAG